jgi:uncharacterized protein (DUF305 family)/Spy/CpxP family protein refolding chaperone
MNMRWAIVFGVVTILALGTTSLLAQPRPGTPGPNNMMPMDVGRHFIEQMIPHHDDAVKMADLAPAQAEHPELRDLAEKIKRVQTDEIALMRGWYQTWYGTAVPSSTTGGMAMGRSDSMVLDGARPFDKVFIEQMIPHHEMAVMMSRMALERVSRPELRGLLQSIITSQSAEIAQMRRWYATWYGVAAPGAGPGATAGHRMGSGMSGPSSPPGHHGQSPSSGQFSPSATIRVHSAEEVRQISAGAGAGLAKAAELNGVPGPRHALDLAVELGLSAQQRTRLQEIYDDMHSKAVTAGQRYIRAQEALEKDFRAGRMTANALPKRVAEVSTLRGELETVHLAAHLATARVLNADQVARYNRLRGH